MGRDPRAIRARRRAAVARRRRLAAAAGVAAILALIAGAVIGAGSGDDGAPAPQPPAPIDRLADLGARELAGQRLVAGFGGADPPQGLLRMLGRGELAGVILFADNLTGGRADARMTRELQRAAGRAPIEAPLLVMTDQEGGQVERLPGPPGASATEMGARGTGYARSRGRATAASLIDAGINVDLAPVLDLGRPGAALAAEGRTFGTRPAEVTAVGVDGFA
ncbi:MAG: hypothetical protein KDB46_13655, partial [Solirubrobacterales bacterium]|nr:hypothetical protein [Solirubrobacterales bacterium]